MSFDRLLRAVLLVTLLAYPAVVYAGLYFLNPQTLGALIAGLVLLRLLLTKHTRERGRPRPLDIIKEAGGDARAPRVALVVGVALLIIGIAANQAMAFLLFPAAVNFLLLAVFYLSLRHPPAIAERFARLQVPELTSQQSAYCRTVTAIWSVFFLLNGLVSLATVFACPLRIWAWYNGFLSYFLMFLLFGLETAYRYWRFRVYTGALLDPLFIKVFPPHRTGE